MKTRSQAGRPTFQIDAKRLKELREERGLTQGQLADAAYELAGRSTERAARTAISSYQKVERTGKTSKAFADALATALGTTVAVIQGEGTDEAPSAIDLIEQQLLAQAKLGTNSALTKRLGRRLGGHDYENDGARIRSLAAEIAGRLEELQFGQRQSELTYLAELTGWSEDKLREPMNIRGYWLLQDSIAADRGAEILLGTGPLLTCLQESFDRVAGSLGSDAVISIREEPPWFYVHVDTGDQRRMRRHSFSFVRCRSSNSGLQWVNPNWRDRLFLGDPLMDWAWRSANFVSGPDGQQLPADVRRLRLAVYECGHDRMPHSRATLVAGDLSDLDDLHESVWADALTRGRTHSLVMDHIAQGAWDELLPLLSSWPLSAWTVRRSLLPIGRPAYIEVVLDAQDHLAVPRGEVANYGRRYILSLVEVISDDEIKVVPWREDSLEKVFSTLRSRLAEEAERERKSAQIQPGA